MLLFRTCKCFFKVEYATQFQLGRTRETELAVVVFRVGNHALPAAFAIHKALKTELKVENRIGATFGKVYCGVVGGVRRHEFAVMGAPVNLAARLMGSKVNKGILVDEAVREQAGNRYSFNSLPPVQAKGYDKPVPILEPLNAVAGGKKKKYSYPFVGRREDKLAISSVAETMLKDKENSQSSVVFLIGESGIGKSVLAASVVEDIKLKNADGDGHIITSAKSTSSETDQRIPLRYDVISFDSEKIYLEIILTLCKSHCSSYRKVFLSMIRAHCEYDGSLSVGDLSCERSAASRSSSFVGLTLRSMHSVTRRRASGVSSRRLGDGGPGSSHHSNDQAEASRRGSLTSTKSGSSTRNLGPGLRRTSWASSRHLGENLSSNHSGDHQTPGRRRSSLTRTENTPASDRRSSLARTDGTPGGERRPSVANSRHERRPPLSRTLSERPSLSRPSAFRGDEDTSESLDTGSSHVSTALRSLASSPANSLYQSRGGGASRKYLPGGLGINSSSHGISKSNHGEYKHKRTPIPGPEIDGVSSSLHKNDNNSLRQSLHRGPGSKGTPSPLRTNSVRSFRLRTPSSKGSSQRMLDDVSMAETDASGHRNDDTSVPYFEKLCWICEELDYPFEYADIVGSQFLGLESANPVTHVDGHVPTMDELVEFLALAFIHIADFADLSIVVLDDFQWVDAFSWKILRVLCSKNARVLLICSTRSHDKQALRRLSTAFTAEYQLQSQITEVSLGPLDFSDIRELVVSVLEVPGSSVDDDLCTDIFQRTGGLPVFVVQTLENIKRKKTLELVDGVVRWTAEGLKEKVSEISNLSDDSMPAC